MSDEPRKRTRDERIADESSTDPALMCNARGCPNIWSVDHGNGRLCSAHAWAPQARWPRITHEQLHAQTERALAASAAAPDPQAAQRDPARIAAALAKLAAPKSPTAWAKRLQWCEQHRNGRLPSMQPMTEFQRWAWRQALRHEPGPDEQPADMPDKVLEVAT